MSTDHPLSGLYLLRYTREGLDPAASILDPPQNTSPGSSSEHSPEAVDRLLRESALNRSMPTEPVARRAYNENYLRDRREMDDYLRHAAEAKGVTPENPYPLHFILHHSPNPQPPLMAGTVMAIPAENVPTSVLSFTKDDSFYNNPQKPTSFRDPDHGTVFSAAEIATQISERGWPGDFPPPAPPNTRRILEAQVWSRRLDDFYSATSHARATEVENEYRQMAPVYDEGSRTGSWAGPRQIAEALREHIKPGMHVVDAGTGTGEVLQRLRGVPVDQPLHLTGLDISNDMLNVTRSKGVADELHKHDLARPWPIADRSQDMVTSSGVMEYLSPAQATRVVREAARVLKPDGRIAITFLPGRPDGDPTHQKLHGAEDVRRLFTENGIKPTGVQEFDAYQGSTGTVRHMLITGVREPADEAVPRHTPTHSGRGSLRAMTTSPNTDPAATPTTATGRPDQRPSGPAAPTLKKD